MIHRNAKKSTALFIATVMATSVFSGNEYASAGFHGWDTSEIYSNSSGSIQFVEFFTSSNSQQFANTFNGNIISNSQSYSFPTNLPGASTNKNFLVGTPSYATLATSDPNVPSPDYTLPVDNFFDAVNGDIVTLRWQGTSVIDPETLAPGDVPTDNTNSLQIAAPGNTRSTGINSPTNFAGQTGTVPEPTSLVLCAIGALLFVLRRQRR